MAETADWNDEIEQTTEVTFLDVIFFCLWNIFIFIRINDLFIGTLSHGTLLELGIRGFKHRRHARDLGINILFFFSTLIPLTTIFSFSHY